MMLYEENVLDAEDPVLWKRRYKHVVSTTYKAVAKLQVHWHVRGKPDAHFRLYETHNRHYQRLQGIVYCRAARLAKLLGDTDFERRAQTGVPTEECAAYVVEETYVSERLGPIHVVRRAPGDYCLFWSRFDGAADTWVFLVCPCRTRQSPEASANRARWSAVTVQRMATDDHRYGERCLLTMTEYDGESRVPRNVFCLNDAAMGYQAFCRDREKWETLYDVCPEGKRRTC